MKVSILGYGKEGRSAEKYFQNHGATTQVFDHFTPDELKQQDFSDSDLVLRSPSVPPQKCWSSITKYFFDHCPCPIIGVTGTKGKGTTCSLITAILQAMHQNVFLVGNIGTPAIDVLDDLSANDVVVYELSSFQLWDLEKSPHIATVLHIEPDHLNVHKDYTDYVAAKANIVRYQTKSDFCIYFKNNQDSYKISELSHGKRLAYPIEDNAALESILTHLSIPGRHNRENAEAALLSVACYFNLDLDTLLQSHFSELIHALETFQGLPHRLQFIRELNNVKYYDDNFSTTPGSTKVALEAFPNAKIILIAGGRDKTANADFPEIIKLFEETKNLNHIVLIGESGHALAKTLTSKQTTTAESLSDAITTARQIAESSDAPAIVLMSPAAASFDMFENVYDRGTQFQNLVQELR